MWLITALSKEVDGWFNHLTKRTDISSPYSLFANQHWLSEPSASITDRFQLPIRCSRSIPQSKSPLNTEGLLLGRWLRRSCRSPFHNTLRSLFRALCRIGWSKIPGKIQFTINNAIPFCFPRHRGFACIPFVLHVACLSFLSWTFQWIVTEKRDLSSSLAKKDTQQTQRIRWEKDHSRNALLYSSSTLHRTHMENKPSIKRMFPECIQ